MHRSWPSSALSFLLLTGCFVDAAGIDVVAPSAIDIGAPDMRVAADELWALQVTFDEDIATASVTLRPSEGESILLDATRAAGLVSVSALGADLAEGAFVVEVSVTDEAGNRTELALDEVLIVDLTPPRVIGAVLTYVGDEVNPFQGAEGPSAVTVGTTILATAVPSELVSALVPSLELGGAAPLSFDIDEQDDEKTKASLLWNGQEGFEGLAPIRFTVTDLAGNTAVVEAENLQRRTDRDGTDTVAIAGVEVLRRSSLMGPLELVYLRDVDAPEDGAFGVLGASEVDAGNFRIPDGALLLANGAEVARVRLAADPQGFFIVAQFDAEAESSVPFNLPGIFLAAVDKAGNLTPYLPVPSSVLRFSDAPDQPSSGFVRTELNAAVDSALAPLALATEPEEDVDGSALVFNEDVWRIMDSRGTLPGLGACTRIVEDHRRGVLVAISANMEVFEFDGLVWSEAESFTAQPPPRSCPSVSYDGSRGRVVVIGGLGSAGVALNEVWEWDGARWFPLENFAQEDPPPGRHRHGAVYDSRNRVHWMMGGEAGDTAFSDIWIASLARCNQPKIDAGKCDPSQRGLDVAFWAEGAALPARSDQAMVFDHQRGVIVVAGGNGGPAEPRIELNDLLEFDVVAGTITQPVADLGFDTDELVGTWDTRRKVTVLAGVDRDTPEPACPDGNAMRLIAWDGTASLYTPVDDEVCERDRFGLAHHRLSDTLVMHSGRVLGAPLAAQLQLVGGPNGAGWHPAELGSTRRPVRRQFASFQNIFPTSFSVLFGGHEPAATGETAFAPDPETWLFDGMSWLDAAVAPGSPSPRTGATSTAIPELGAVALFGGFDGSAQQDTRADMFFFPLSGPNAFTWVPGSVGPPARAFGNLVHIPADTATGRGARLVLFGGLSLYAPDEEIFDPTAAGLGDTWELELSTGVWTETTPATSPPARAYASAAYEPTTDTVVLFGGASQLNALGDTWRYTAAVDPVSSTWTEVDTGVLFRPGPRAAAAMTFDGRRGRITLIGGQDEQNTQAEVWELSDDRWAETTPTPLPTRGASAIYDARTGRSVIFGGGSELALDLVVTREARTDEAPAIGAATSLLLFGVDPSTIESITLRAECSGQSDTGNGARLLIWANGDVLDEAGDPAGAGAWSDADANNNLVIAGRLERVVLANELAEIIQTSDGFLSWQCRSGTSDAPRGAHIRARSMELNVQYTFP